MRSNKKNSSSHGFSRKNNTSPIDEALTNDQGFLRTSDAYFHEVESVVMYLRECGLDENQLRRVYRLTDWDIILGNNAIIAFLKLLNTETSFIALLQQGEKGLSTECYNRIIQLISDPITTDLLTNGSWDVPGAAQTDDGLNRGS